MREDILNTLGFIDDGLIEKAENYVVKKKKLNWAVLGTIAAAVFMSVILFSTVGILYIRNNSHSGSDIHNNQFITAQLQPIEFKLNGAWYYPIPYGKLAEYGLIQDEDSGQSGQRRYVITEDDLGSKMGVIKRSTNKALNGLTVYHFASREDDNSICIIEVNGTYAVYVRE